MKVQLGRYLSYFGPYQLAQLLMFWKDKNDDCVFKLAQFLMYGRSKDQCEANETWLYKLLHWIYSKRTRKISIRIDPYDTWDMDHTLSLIIAPMLRQLQKNKHGSPPVDDSDVPDHLRRSQPLPPDDPYDVDDKFHDRWSYVLDEMIWAFEATADDQAEDKFYQPRPDTTKEHDFLDNLSDNLSNVKYDRIGLEEFRARKANGFRLFGKYFTALWD